MKKIRPFLCATLSALPMFILFFTLQKYFLEGVTIGAVKG